MINGKKILAIIPARAGSKRVVNKNIRDLGGIPLIGWTLKDLYKSKYIDHAYVTTDSSEIQKIAKNYNVDCEPLRPSDLASDTANSVDVVLDVINHRKPGFDIIVLLQPTSPLRKIDDVDMALEFFMEKSACSVTSVCEVESHPSWSACLPDDRSMNEMIKKMQSKRSQDLETYHKLNGAIYIISVEEFKKAKSFFAQDKAFAYFMNRKDSIDIDTEEDLVFANCLLMDKNKT
jgi:CMP-N,N'-diacetyllegionaminic acid synthase